MISYLIEGFALGISTGPYCFSACSPMLVPYLLADSRSNWKGNIKLLLEFVMGRLVAYLLFGTVAGMIAKEFSGQIPPIIIKGSVLLSGFLMLAYFLYKKFPHLSFCKIVLKPEWSNRFPFILGFLIGINLCPPFVTGLIRVFESGSVEFGIIYFAAFFFGTTLFLIPLIALVPFVLTKRLQFIGELTCAFTSLWFIGIGMAGLFFSR